MVDFKNMNRCYDGCPDSGMKARWDETARLEKEIRKLNPEAHCTWFPIEGKWMSHIWGKPLTGFCYSRDEALREGIRNLELKSAS